MRNVLAILGVLVAMATVGVASAAERGATVGYVGLGLSDVSRADKDENGGAKVEHVDSQSPAAKAGIKEGDVLVRFDGERVRSVSQLARLVRETPPGRPASVEFLRGDVRQSVVLTVGERREDWRDWGRELRDRLEAPLPNLRQWGREMAEDWPFGAEAERRRPSRLGITYEEISGQLARFFRVEQGRGILVTEVAADSAADRAGLRAGDVLVAMDGHSIEDGHDLRRTMASIEEGRTVAVKVLREGKAVELKLAFPEGRRPEDEHPKTDERRSHDTPL